MLFQQTPVKQKDQKIYSSVNMRALEQATSEKTR